jgi:nitroreductase
MLNDASTALSLLRTRRSGKPRGLVEPGPDARQLREMIAIAGRTPDHGKLTPWRFLHIRREDRAALAGLLERAYRAANPEPGRLEIEAAHRFGHQAPELVVAFSCPVEGTKIPVWEQELSCGAACMNFQHAAHAMGFVTGLVTGWAAYSPAVLVGLGAAPNERIAGFIFIGTPAEALEERIRPEVEHIYAEWSPASGSRG